MNENYYLRNQENLAAKRWWRWFWAWWSIYSVVLVFLACLYVLAIGQWKVLVIALAAFFLARVIISPLIYILYKKARPYQLYNFKPFSSWFYSRLTDRQNAFPSDHSLSLSSISFVLFWFFPTLGITLFVITFFNGWARVVVGYHDAFDVLGGWIIGIMSAVLMIYLLTPFLMGR